MSNEMTLDGEALRRAVLARLRFERAMGLEFTAVTAVSAVTAGERAITTGDGRDIGQGSGVRAGVPAPVALAASIEPPPVMRAAPMAMPSLSVTTPSVSPSKAIPSAPVVRPAAPSAVALAEASALPPPVPAGRVEDSPARWAALEAKALACTTCALSQGRNSVVFGTGDRKARLLFVGEGPGADEDRLGEPFVGNAGQLLNKIIAAMGLKREDIYICNVVKCRPPQNRPPLPDEVAACSPYLIEQIELVAPEVLVALGGSAAKALLNTTSGIMALRGKWHTFRGVPLMPTYHPSFLLHQYTEPNRRAVWEDMKKVMDRLKR